MSLDEAQAVLTGLKSMKLLWHPIAHLSESALEIACQLGRTAYDSIYLALAVIENGVLITSDERLYNAISASQLSPSIALLSHFTAWCLRRGVARVNSGIRPLNIIAAIEIRGFEDVGDSTATTIPTMRIRPQRILR